MTPAAALDAVSLEISTRSVLDGVSLAIPAGEITVLVGPNGCGKSTIARMLAGFIFPTRGVVRVLGGQLGQMNVHELRERVKLVQPTQPHDPAHDVSVFEVILTGVFGTVDLYDEPTMPQINRAKELIAKLRLERVANSLYKTCSSGERMRTQIARALMSRPKLLILDEPTTGLDLPMREQLLLTIDRIHRDSDSPAIVLVTHHLEEIPPSASHAILMSVGRVLASGSPRDVLRSETLSEAFAFPITVTLTEEGRYFAHARASSLE